MNHSDAQCQPLFHIHNTNTSLHRAQPCCLPAPFVTCHIGSATRSSESLGMSLVPAEMLRKRVRGNREQHCWSSSTPDTVVGMTGHGTQCFGLADKVETGHRLDWMTLEISSNPIILYTSFYRSTSPPSEQPHQRGSGSLLYHYWGTGDTTELVGTWPRQLGALGLVGASSGLLVPQLPALALPELSRTCVCGQTAGKRSAESFTQPAGREGGCKRPPQPCQWFRKGDLWVWNGNSPSSSPHCLGSHEGMGLSSHRSDETSYSTPGSPRGHLPAQRKGCKPSELS